MRPGLFPVAWLPVCLLVAPVGARPAAAAEEEILLAFEPGYTLLTQRSQGEAQGGGGQASLWYGITDLIWFGLSAGVHVTRSPGAQGAGPEALILYEAMGGCAAAFDVFRTVPFLEAFYGAVASKRGARPAFRFGLGADYFISPLLSVGGVLRLRPVTQDTGKLLFTASFRLAHRFDP